MTQIEAARQGRLTPEMSRVAGEEHIPEDSVQKGVMEGTIVIPANSRRRGTKVSGIGAGLRTKVNANIGTSQEESSVERELEKLRVAELAGADAVMDLSTGGDLDEVRRAILAGTHLPVGTVPIYQAAVESATRKGSIARMSAEDIFSAIERHGADGVDFITVHCGVTRETLERLREEGRIMDVVSRGGAFLIEWMVVNDRENPLYEEYDRLLEIAARYDMTLSLGDGLRPGCLADATDRAQVRETILLGELAARALRRGVQVMIEGPGHMPMDQVAANVMLEKRLCHGAPFYVLGPLVTDVAAGYDHVAAAIGGAIAAAAGADFLCYVTPSEHLRLPTVEDVREGVMVARVAAHAADIAKKIPGARDWDDEISRKRKARKWDEQLDLAMDAERARDLRRSALPRSPDVCTMCGDFCAMKRVDEFFRKKGTHPV